MLHSILKKGRVMKKISICLLLVLCVVHAAQCEEMSSRQKRQRLFASEEQPVAEEGSAETEASSNQEEQKVSPRVCRNPEIIRQVNAHFDRKHAFEYGKTEDHVSQSSYSEAPNEIVVDVVEESSARDTSLWSRIKSMFTEAN